MRPRNARILMMGKMQIEIKIDGSEPARHFQIVRAVDDVAGTECMVDVILRRPDQAVEQEQQQPGQQVQVQQPEYRGLKQQDGPTLGTYRGEFVLPIAALQESRNFGVTLKESAIQQKRRHG